MSCFIDPKQKVILSRFFNSVVAGDSFEVKVAVMSLSVFAKCISVSRI